MTPQDWEVLAPHGITPDNLTVGGDLDLTGCTGIAPLYEDVRDYRLDRAGDRYHAGCRRFTAAEAIAHWGSDAYPDKPRGAAYVAAVTAEESRRRRRRQE